MRPLVGVLCALSLEELGLLWPVWKKNPQVSIWRGEPQKSPKVRTRVWETTVCKRADWAYPEEGVTGIYLSTPEYVQGGHHQQGQSWLVDQPSCQQVIPE